MKKFCRHLWNDHRQVQVVPVVPPVLVIRMQMVQKKLWKGTMLTKVTLKLESVVCH
jgi:hypothetical protein